MCGNPASSRAEVAGVLYSVKREHKSVCGHIGSGRGRSFRKLEKSYYLGGCGQTGNLPENSFFNKNRITDTEPLSDKGVLVMGNEGKGISEETTPYINRKLYIPPFGVEAPASESLNVATTTAIALAQFRDFPTPGSPPSSTMEPFTSPPPSTRFSSLLGIGMRGSSIALM